MRCRSCETGGLLREINLTVAPGYCSTPKAFASEDSLDRPASARQLTRLLLGLRHVKDLQHHRIESGAWQRHSSARYGQEKGWSRPARDKKRIAHFRTQFTSTTHLGTGTEEVCAYSRDGARS